MDDSHKLAPSEKDIELALTALKKGATLLKFGRRGKPKFCPFRLSNDESVLIWYSGKEEKQLKISEVSRIIPGQRTGIFKRYPRPDKEYQSFSLIYTDRTLDVICKDKEEAKVWFIGLKALTSNNGWCKWRNEARESITSAYGSTTHRSHQTCALIDDGDALCQLHIADLPRPALGKSFSDLSLYTVGSNNCSLGEASSYASLPPNGVGNSTDQRSSSDNVRISSSPMVSKSSVKDP